MKYIGVDETGLGIGHENLIVVAAESSNSNLAKDKGWRKLRKAKDFLQEAVRHYEETGEIPKHIFPTYQELQASGLEKFYWTRATGGRFSRQLVEHASIAYLVANNGYTPQNTVLLIDAFHGDPNLSHHLIKEFLHRNNFKIPSNQIEIHGGGDRSIPIVNYADILAFQIGINFHEQYKQWRKKKLDFPVKPLEIPYDEQRCMSLDEEGRSQLETIIRQWKGADYKFKKHS